MSPAPYTVIELVSPPQLRIHDIKLFGGGGMPDMHFSLGKMAAMDLEETISSFPLFFLHLKLYSY